MLPEPRIDAQRAGLERALVEAARARLAAGPWPSPDAAALALRPLLTGSGSTDAVLKAMAGRIDAATGRPLVVCGGLAQALAADRYGLTARPLAVTEAALKAVEDGGRALIDLTHDRPWWGRLLARRDLRIVAALPDDRQGRPRALMVSGQTPGPTGDDRSFWVTDSGWSDGRIVQALSDVGLAAEPLAASGGLKLFTLAGYVQAEDGRLDGAPGSLSGVIGAAPLF